MSDSQPLRAGRGVDDYCRPCKMERSHTVLATQVGDSPARVRCDTCGSQHNYRGGRGPRRSEGKSRPSTPGVAASFPIVSERETTAGSTIAVTSTTHPTEGDDPMNPDNTTTAADLEMLLRRVIREESGLTAATPAEKWIGGEMILRPGKEGLQDKSVPIETFFHKIVMLRNRIRVMEQQINGSDLPEDVKLKLQAHITGCYGSLTSFNILFADEEDRFRGAAGKGGS